MKQSPARLSHAPLDYRCPFCRLSSLPTAEDRDRTVHRYQNVVVSVNPRWWPRNRGGLLVIPSKHHENVYDLPAALGTPLQQATRDAAFALKNRFHCDGISTRQHNEPAGGQHVWHYHIHVFPRYVDDGLYREHGYPAAPQDVFDVATELRAVWRIT